MGICEGFSKCTASRRSAAMRRPAQTTLRLAATVLGGAGESCAEMGEIG